MTAVLIAGVVGSPISGALLSLRGFGLAGWHWLFLLEGLPAVVLGFVVLRALPERPQDARWLSHAEQSALNSCAEIALQECDFTQAPKPAPREVRLQTR